MEDIIEYKGETDLVMLVRTKAPALLEKHEYWVHRQGSNWIARISGKDDKYGVKRDFLEKFNDGRQKFFRVADFEVDGIYQVGSKRKYYENYHSVEEVAIKSYFVCTKVESDHIRLAPIEYRDVLEFMENPEHLQEKAAKKYISNAVELVGKAKALELLAGMK